MTKTKTIKETNEEDSGYIQKKEKEIEYEVVKSSSGLPMFVLPLPDGIDFTKDEPQKRSNDD
jgi:hypothetical protein